MTAKEYLEQIKHKDVIINNMIHEKEFLMNEMCGVKAVRYDLDKVQSSPDGDRMATIMAEIEEKEEEINRQIDDLCDFRLQVTRLINALQDEKHISVLYKRYVQFQTWGQIAGDLQYTDRHVMRLHGAALDAFYKKYHKKLNLSKRCQ